MVQEYFSVPGYVSFFVYFCGEFYGGSENERKNGGNHANFASNEQNINLRFRTLLSLLSDWLYMCKIFSYIWNDIVSGKMMRTFWYFFDAFFQMQEVLVLLFF